MRIITERLDIIFFPVLLSAFDNTCCCAQFIVASSSQSVSPGWWGLFSQQLILKRGILIIKPHNLLGAGDLVAGMTPEIPLSIF